MTRITLIIAFAAAITGCYRDRALVKPQPVEVPTYIREPIPAQLTAPIVVTWPDGACWAGTERALCNGQLASLLIDYREAVEMCNADRQALRSER